MKKINNMYKAIIAISILILTSACTERVPPGYKGKVLTVEGYSGSLQNPGNATVYGRDRLILVESGIYTETEPMQMKMRDELTLKFDVKISGQLDIANPDVANAMFNDVAPVGNIISAKSIYDKTTKMIVRNVAREVVSAYAVKEVSANYKRISQELQIAISEATKTSAFRPTIVTLGDVEYPDAINQAIEEALAKDLEKAKTEAQVAVDMTRKNGEKALAEKQAEIDLVKAQSLRDQNKLIAAGLSEELLKYRALEVQEKIAEKAGEGDLIIAPYEAMSNVSLQNRMYSKKN